MSKPFAFPKKAVGGASAAPQGAGDAPQPGGGAVMPFYQVKKAEGSVNGAQDGAPGTSQVGGESAVGSNQQQPTQPHKQQQQQLPSQGPGEASAGAGAGAEELTVEEEALLLRQCRLSKVELVDAAIDSGRVGVNFVFSNGDNMLMTACKNGFKRLARSLVKRGCGLDAVDKDGNTAAHWCFASNYPELGEYLIVRGASDTITNNKGLTCRQLLLKTSVSSSTHHSQTAGKDSPSASVEAHKGGGGGGTNLPNISTSSGSSNANGTTQVALGADPRPAGRAQQVGEKQKQQRGEGRGAGLRERRKQQQAKGGGGGGREHEETPYERMYVNINAPAPRGEGGSVGQISPKNRRGSPLRGSPRAKGGGVISPNSRTGSEGEIDWSSGNAGSIKAREAPAMTSLLGAKHTELDVGAATGNKLLTLDNFDQSPLAAPKPKTATGALVMTSGGLQRISSNEMQRQGTRSGSISMHNSGVDLNRSLHGSSMEINRAASTEGGVSTRSRTGSVAGSAAGGNRSDKQEDRAEARINSPRSLEALKRCGIVVKELLQVPLERLKKQYEPAVAEMRYKIVEDHRQGLLAKARAARNSINARSRDASLNVLFVEYSKVHPGQEERGMTLNGFINMLTQLEVISSVQEAGTITKTAAVAWFNKYSTMQATSVEKKEGPDNVLPNKQLTLSWEQFVQLERSLSATTGRLSRVSQGLGTNRSTGSKKSTGSAVSGVGTFHKADPLESLKAKNERSRQNELRRMEKQLSNMLGQRAEHQELSEGMVRKEKARLLTLEQRTMAIAEQRIDAQVRHVEKWLKQEETFRVKQEEEAAKIEQRERLAALLIEQRQREVQERKTMQTEIGKVKQEMRRQELEQRKRREAYNKELMVLRIERDGARTEVEKVQRKQVKAELKKMWTKNHHDRLVLSTMSTEFEKTGELKLPKTAGKNFDELVKSAGVPFDGEDRNPDAILLQQGEPTAGRVSKGECVYYKCLVEKAKMVKFDVNRSGVNMYVGNGVCSRPTKRNSVWSKGTKFSVFHVEKAFMLGWFYICIEGATDGHPVDFLLTVSWADSDALNLSANVTAASVQAAHGEDAGETENQVLTRCQHQVEQMMAAKLKDKDPEFRAKFQELFAGSKH